MKKALLLFVLFTAFQSIHAQTSDFSVQVKVTTELADFNHRHFDSQPKFSLGGGIVLEKRLSSLLSGQVGLLFKNRGWQDRLQLTDRNGDPFKEVTYKENFNYLSLPILIKGNFHKVYVSVGPSIDIFMNAKTDFGSVSKENLNTINSSIYIGVGYRFDLSDLLFLNLEANYDRTLISIFKYSKNLHGYNYGLGFGFGYKL